VFCSFMRTCFLPGESNQQVRSRVLCPHFPLQHSGAGAMWELQKPPFLVLYGGLVLWSVPVFMPLFSHFFLNSMLFPWFDLLYSFCILCEYTGFPAPLVQGEILALFPSLLAALFDRLFGESFFLLMSPSFFSFQPPALNSVRCTFSPQTEDYPFNTVQSIFCSFLPSPTTIENSFLVISQNQAGAFFSQAITFFRGISPPPD